MKNSGNLTNKISALLPWLTAILPPWVYLFYFYRGNMQFLSYWHVLITSLCLTPFAMILQFIMSRLSKSPEVGAIASSLLWIFIFSLKTWFMNFVDLVYIRNFIFGAVVLLILIMIIITLIYLKKYFQYKKLLLLLWVFWTILFALNFVPSTFYRIIDKRDTPDFNTIVKTSFYVDESLPSPNIYWFFMDGMLGFKAFDYFFHDPQTGFVENLTERGFMINYDARFEALHSTSYAAPSLMSPDWYISFMIPALKEGKDPIYATEAREKNEMITAFDKKGYVTNIVELEANQFFYPTTTTYWASGGKISTIPNDKYEEYIKFYELQKLFVGTTIFFYKPLAYIFVPFWNKLTEILFGIEIDLKPKEVREHWRMIYLDPLRTILEGPQPCLTIIHDHLPHFPFIYNEDLTRHRRGLVLSAQYDMYNYPPQHHASVNVINEYLDLILSHDPDAVIVIQADHGLHGDKTRELFLASGGAEEEVRLMQNSTISAVRIPEKWGGLDAPLEPLNIARVLVNRFVGQNYQLLEPDEIIR